MRFLYVLIALLAVVSAGCQREAKKKEYFEIWDDMMFEAAKVDLAHRSLKQLRAICKDETYLSTERGIRLMAVKDEAIEKFLDYQSRLAKLQDKHGYIRRYAGELRSAKSDHDEKLIEAGDFVAPLDSDEVEAFMNEWPDLIRPDAVDRLKHWETDRSRWPF